LRICGITAGAAFALSFFISLVSRTSMPVVIIRPLIFGVLFFVISCIVNFLADRFLPELLDRDNDEDGADLLPGSRIDLTVGDSSDFPQDNDPAVVFPGLAFVDAEANDSEEGLGNISSLTDKNAGSQSAAESTSIGMDQNTADSYTKAKGTEELSLPWQAGSNGSGASRALPDTGFTATTPGIPNSDDTLPDLDSMAGAFLSSAGEESDTVEYSVSAPAKKSSSGKKGSEWSGDFNAKDLAAGLRTVLNKDKEG
jgi:hypothetical protein